MIDDGALAAIGAAIVGFGIVAFVFRVQRELQVRDAAVQKLMGAAERQGRQVTRVEETELREKAEETRWIPWADRLLIGTVTVSLLLVLFPIALAGSFPSPWVGRLSAAACSASTVALAGYIPALLAHYKFGPHPANKWIWFGDKIGPYTHAKESAEEAIVIISVVLGAVAAMVSVAVTG